MLLCRALASASLATADKLAMSSYFESTESTTPATVKEGFLVQYRQRSFFAARKHLVPAVNPHTSNVAMK